jgi:hypothetical protein
VVRLLIEITQERNEMERYNALVSACQIVKKARMEVYSAESTSPAWDQLYRICDLLKKQACDEYRLAIGQ